MPVSRDFSKFSLRPLSLEKRDQDSRWQAAYREFPMIIAHDNIPLEKGYTKRL